MRYGHGCEVKPFVALPPSSVHPNSNAALGTGLRRYDGVGAPIRPGGTSYARHTGEGRNPDRRPDMNQCAFQARPVVEPFVALPPSSVHPNSHAALGTGLRRYDGVGAPIRSGRTSYARHSGEGRNPEPTVTFAAHAELGTLRPLPHHTPHWVPACAGTTGWGAGASSPLACRYDGLVRWCLFSVALPA